MSTVTATPPSGRRLARSAWSGALVGVVLVVLAFWLPHLMSFETFSRTRYPGEEPVPPLRGYLEVKAVGFTTVRVVLVGVVAWLVLPRLARLTPWPALLLVSYAAGLAWLLALAYVDGAEGISRVEDMPGEYLTTARGITDVPATLDGFVGRITYGEPDSWATHVSGHPPAALLFFVLLVRVGVDTSFGVGMAVTLLAAAAVPGVLVTLRALGAEPLARRVLPFLVLSPAAVLTAVSADAVFVTVSAWGLAALALAATASTRRRAVGWSVLAGVVLGLGVFLSYGLLLIGPVALAVLAAARSWRPLPWAIGGALVVVAGFGALGFWWWEAYGPLRERYLAGLGGRRPQSYWVWGNLAALVVSAGPVLGAGLACALTRVRATVTGAVDERRTAVLLSLSAAAAVLVADLSGMSKSEVERIWLPWVPWLLLSAALLPPRWHRPALAVQVAGAVVLQQLVFTQW
ncbi:hypothetical protein FE634_08080 [Nocardioides dongxiaopingii]|uniref:hypothetical protein n=1 Tax=Nocardioides sp. S-1144 TaxID=2582905 RepID=UPI00116320FF|nr:hypothetical protein [Nocardioides sp. S-1144]QCW50376.2 hypothetical protein FE634_08080 [Nocardioides sp. S-1144]